MDCILGPHCSHRPFATRTTESAVRSRSEKMRVSSRLMPGEREASDRSMRLHPVGKLFGDVFEDAVHQVGVGIDDHDGVRVPARRLLPHLVGDHVVHEGGFAHAGACHVEVVTAQQVFGEVDRRGPARRGVSYQRASPGSLRRWAEHPCSRPLHQRCLVARPRWVPEARGLPDSQHAAPSEQPQASGVQHIGVWRNGTDFAHLEPRTGGVVKVAVGPKKQRHTAKRIFERLRDEYGFGGQYTIVKDYARERRRQTREMFVPLSHSPGHAQCDFGEARVVIGGVRQKAHYFVLDLPHSDGCFVKAYPAETTEAFLDGHVSALAFLGGVPRSILYDNTKLAVARILGDGRRKRTRAFTELQSHYLFEDRFGRPGRGNDKGKVEGMVGYVRRNFLVPVPSFDSFDALNAHLEQQCLKRMDAQLRGHTETIGQRMERDLEALLKLPSVSYDACDKQGGRVNPNPPPSQKKTPRWSRLGSRL